MSISSNNYCLSLAVPDSGLSTAVIRARDVGAVLLVAAAGLLLLQEI